MSINTGYYGYLAGMITTFTLQPLDNIKMTLIIPPAKLNYTRNFITNVGLAAKYIYYEEGWRAFYKGLVSNAWKTGVSSSVYFHLLREIQAFFRTDSKSNSTQVNFFASCTARVASSVVSNPFSIIESRYEIPGKQKWEGSIAGSMKRIYQGEGVRGFFKGALANSIKESSFAGLYYALYEEGRNLGIPAMASGMASGFFSTFITHPFETIRINIQVHHNFTDGH